jgi:2-(1,2-epoxy-1,2-dihydrophenyl)acetyl-CoA isomerase
MTDHLLVTKEDGVATMTMNRPEARNAVTLEMRKAMFDTVDDFEHDSSVRCVVLRGAGGHFMAGGDIRNMNDYLEMEPLERKVVFQRRVHDLNSMMLALKRMDKPVIASVQGAAAGAGMSFMLACDLAICSDDAFFKFSYVGIGASPDGSGSYHLPRIIGVRKALELALLGDTVDAGEALRLGLVNWVVPATDIDPETDKLARRLASGPTVSLANIKRLTYASYANSYPAQLAMEAENFGICAATDDWAEGVTAFLEKRKPQFVGK